MAVRMVIAYKIENGWTLMVLNVKNAIFHETYKYPSPLFIREAPRDDGTYKHGWTIGFLILNLYGNRSGTYYYVEGPLDYFSSLRKAETSRQIK